MKRKRTRRTRRATPNMMTVPKDRRQRRRQEALVSCVSGVSVIWATRVSSMQSCRCRVRLHISACKQALQTLMFSSPSQNLSQTQFLRELLSQISDEKSCFTITPSSELVLMLTLIMFSLCINLHLTAYFHIMFSGTSSDPAGKTWVAHAGYVSVT